MKHLLWALALLPTLTTMATAGPVTIPEARATATGETWRFDVTLSHGDTGWEHYADAWQVETATGRVLGTRILHHPHVNEQPFTRALSGVDVPSDVTTVYIRARDSLHGWSEEMFAITLRSQP